MLTAPPPATVSFQATHQSSFCTCGPTGNGDDHNGVGHTTGLLLDLDVLCSPVLRTSRVPCARCFQSHLWMYGVSICATYSAGSSCQGSDAAVSSPLVTLYLWPLLSHVAALAFIHETAAQPLTLVSLIIVLTAVQRLPLGPIGYMLVVEIPSTRLRVKTVVGRGVYNITSIITNKVASRMLLPSA